MKTDIVVMMNICRPAKPTEYTTAEHIADHSRHHTGMRMEMVTAREDEVDKIKNIYAAIYLFRTNMLWNDRTSIILSELNSTALLFTFSH